jgi:excisionase family DNA binding protein
METINALLATIMSEGRATATVEEAGQVLGISRGLAYEGVRRGEIPSVRVGHRILVPIPALLAALGSPEADD